MTIQPISDASVALYITPADLKEHGLTPAALTLERAPCSGGTTAGGSLWRPARRGPPPVCPSSAGQSPPAPTWRPAWPSTAARCGAGTP